MKRLLLVIVCCLAGCGSKEPTEEQKLEKSLHDAIPAIKATQEDAAKQAKDSGAPAAASYSETGKK